MDQFFFCDFYDDGGGLTSIRGKNWQPAFFSETSTGPTNPPSMTDGEYRRFQMQVSGKRGSYDFDYCPHTMDSTMRLIWDAARLDRVSEGWWVQSPHTTLDTWWFGQNPYWGDDTAWLCVNFNSGSFDNDDTKHAVICGSSSRSTHPARTCPSLPASRQRITTQTPG